MKSIIGRKMGMTEVFAADGTMVAVTVVEVLPNVVLDKKTLDKDGYEALVVGYEDKPERKASKAEKGRYKKSGVTAYKRVVKELKGDEIYGKALGESFGAETFAAGEVIDVIGHNKGHGYVGNVKKWHHSIGPKGHGSGYHRGIGSLANNGRCNNRVIPGKKMAGHWGPEQVTVQNLTVIESNSEKGYILVKGGLPGPRKAIVVLRSPVRHQFRKPVVKPILDLSEKKGE
ncbi:MAG: 50S ribosomal protein L3 [Bacilli bacterium]|nr:50S ribosomal protein L3 [Bacilli bacterium]